ncbi:trypsin-like serine peptidase [Streptomyces chrestomyceticus]|uniref:trypsin-like serine peptidase n=1 Tax=Streptomyces chrestomyceticus TaxID=68185 RepID=UPI0019D1716E|nr:peptidase [Streptomyces chrestomyceticus]
MRRNVSTSPGIRRRGASRAVACALTAAGALLVSALQTGAAGAAGTDAASTSARTGTPSSVADFWTAERMREATPLDLLSAGADGPTRRSAAAAKQPASAEKRSATAKSRSATAEKRSGSTRNATPATSPARRGSERTVRPTLPATTTSTPASAPALKSFPQAGAAWTGGGAVTNTAGRVFFTYQGRTASCSGNAVTSANKSTVLTAGHCVKLNGAWHGDWVFVPGYHDGQAPYGKWAAAKTLATPQWTASENINYDIGAAVVAPVGGQRLTDVVGGQGLAFNTGYNKPMYAFGYPAAAPYDGSKLIYCSGNTIKDPLFSTDHGLSCNMTGGSSGGPWFTSFDEASGTGLQSSVNSFGYTFLPNTMFGPYFGDDAENLYDEAQSS